MTTQQRDLAGLKALVTGATSGLGRAIASQLARDGADVIVHGATPRVVHRQSKRSSHTAAAPATSGPTSATPRASRASPRR